jgi:hypothetical protein
MFTHTCIMSISRKTSFFNHNILSKKTYLNSHKKNPPHFGQVDFKMSILIRWSFFIGHFIYEAMDHLSVKLI